MGAVFASTVRSRSTTDRILAAGRVAAIAGVTFQTVAHFVNASFFDTRVLDANSEGSVPTWANTAAIFAAAFACGLHALLSAEHRRLFVALAAILAFLSLDEMTVVHERVANQAVGLGGLDPVWDSVVWPALYGPLLATLLVLFFAAARAGPAAPGGYVVFGAALLIAAVLLEILSAPVSTGSNWAHTLEGGFEEAAELGGWIAIATGLTAIALAQVEGLRLPSERRGPERARPPQPGDGERLRASSSSTSTGSRPRAARRT
jgi:hypothetical protein